MDTFHFRSIIAHDGACQNCTIKITTILRKGSTAGQPIASFIPNYLVNLEGFRVFEATDVDFEIIQQQVQQKTTALFGNLQGEAFFFAGQKQAGQEADIRMAHALTVRHHPVFDLAVLQIKIKGSRIHDVRRKTQDIAKLQQPAKQVIGVIVVNIQPHELFHRKTEQFGINLAFLEALQQNFRLEKQVTGFERVELGFLQVEHQGRIIHFGQLFFFLVKSEFHRHHDLERRAVFLFPALYQEGFQAVVPGKTFNDDAGFRIRNAVQNNAYVRFSQNPAG